MSELSPLYPFHERATGFNDNHRHRKKPRSPPLLTQYPFLQHPLKPFQEFHDFVCHLRGPADVYNRIRSLLGRREAADEIIGQKPAPGDVDTRGFWVLGLKVILCASIPGEVETQLLARAAEDLIEPVEEKDLFEILLGCSTRVHQLGRGRESLSLVQKG